ncbi:MAG: 50S ribosome-binding GTPase [Planctomycetota bacterium]|nr:50S ribosome-binding GTPase [Planctomycetota bacterium]
MSGDTIASLSSASGGGAVSIVRISGEKAFEIARAVVEEEIKREGFAAKDMVIRVGGMRFWARLFLFRKPYSYTAEDLVEIHLFGCGILSSLLLDELIRKGARAAVPGEFTRRAFEAGRISLAQAEAVNSLVRACDEWQRKEAVGVLVGESQKRFERIRERLVELLGLVEAELDFSDQEVEGIERDELLCGMRETMKEMKKACPRVMVARAVPRVVLKGKANVGKSTLFNALLGKERALTAESPGTTRDFIEEEIVVDDVRFVLVDTAGEGVEDEFGILARSKVRSVEEGSALVLEVSDVESIEWESGREEVPVKDERTIFVLNKSDKGVPKFGLKGQRWFIVSALRGDGIDSLKEEIVRRLRYSGGEGDSSFVQRRREAVNEAFVSLCRAYRLVRVRSYDELVAFHLRESVTILSSLFDSDVSEDILSAIFSRFCIGK